MTEAIIQIQDLEKRFRSKNTEVYALQGINLTIRKGDIFGIIGKSGAGKSTLVRCINMLERPTGGSVMFEGRDMCRLGSRDLQIARRSMGMIFQQFNLLMQRTAEENICFPLELAGVKKDAARERARELLELVNLSDRAQSYPSQLSGGQKQRVAIARALATNPKILLCDEATSALDPATTESILSLIKDINRKMGITVIVITHQMSVVEEICNKVSILDHGNVVEEGAVSEVFSHPKSEAAKRLVFPDGVADTLPIKEGEHHIRVVFNGADAANTPLIAKLAMETHIAANILGANTKSIEGKAYGNMLLGISGDENTLQQAIAYLQKIDDIIVEEVSAHVR